MNQDDRNLENTPLLDNVEEFMALINSHQRRLYIYVLMLLPNANDAEDVLQNTNLVLWRKSNEFRAETNFYAWACRIAYYEVLKYREKNSKQAGIFNDAVISQLVEDESIASQDDARRDALLICINKLSSTDRDLINRRYHEQASGKSLSEDLGRPINSIYKSLGRIRQALMNCINRTLAAENISEDLS